MNDFSTLNLQKLDIDTFLENPEGVFSDTDMAVYESEHFEVRENLLPTKTYSFIWFLCVAGTAEIGIDMNQYIIEPNSFVILQRAHYVTSFKASKDFRAVGMMLSPDIMQKVLPAFSDLLRLVVKLRMNPIMKFSEKGVDEIFYFLKYITNCFRPPFSQLRKMALINTLQASFYMLLDTQNNLSYTSLRPFTRKEEIMTKFMIEVSENFREQRQVVWYAERLCISPKHLSCVVKELSGMTAGDCIEYFVIMEAKVLLRTTSLTIQEITHKLNFANQSFFGKYFKHFTGESPSEFRRKSIEKLSSNPDTEESSDVEP